MNNQKLREAAVKMHSLFAVVATLMISGAFAQGNPIKALGNVANAQLTECQTKMKQLQDSVMADYNKANAAGLIDTSEAAEFKRLETEINERVKTNERNGVTLSECERMQRFLSSAKATVAKMSTPNPPPVDPKLSNCFNANQQAEGVMRARYGGYANSGEVKKEVIDAFKASDATLTDLKAQARRTGSLADCERVGPQIDAMNTIIKKAWK